jgi:hypothetical protein
MCQGVAPSFMLMSVWENPMVDINNIEMIKHAKRFIFFIFQK